MPFIPLLAILFAAGSAIFGTDQHKKRMKEQKEYRAHIDELEKQLAEMTSRLGTKNEQVRMLSELIQWMRQGSHKAA